MNESAKKLKICKKEAMKFSKKYAKETIIYINPLTGSSKWFSLESVSNYDASLYIKEGYTETFYYDKEAKFCTNILELNKESENKYYM